MGRKQWIGFTVGMCTLFPSIWLCVPFAKAHPWLLVFPVVAFCTVIGVVLSIPVQAIRNARLRSRGVPVVGRVIHARSSGYTNNVHTWELEVALPNGTTGHLLVTRFAPFSPGESIRVIADPGNPSHITTPSAPNYDF